jgi:hypothetical protein
MIPSPPTQTGQAVLPHPAFQFVALDGLAQARDSRAWEESGQPRGLAPRSPAAQAVHCQVGVRTQARCSGASGRSALRHHPDPFGSSFRRLPTPRPCPPSLHDHYSLHRYYEGSDPDRPFRRQPWFPDSRHLNFPPFRLQPSAVLSQTRSTPSTLGALFCSDFAVSLAGSSEPPTESSSPCPEFRTLLRTGCSLPVALHPGISPRRSYLQLLALQCRPGQGLSPRCSSALSGALGRRAPRAPRIGVTRSLDRDFLSARFGYRVTRGPYQAELCRRFAWVTRAQPPIRGARGATRPTWGPSRVSRSAPACT